MSKSQKKELLSIIIGAILLAAAVIVTKTVLKGPTWAVLLIFLVPYLWLGYKVLFDAVHGLVSGSFMDENFLMSVASIGALCIGEHTEAVLVMLLYCIGELLEELAIGRSRSSIAALTDIRPDRANLEKNGEIIETDCEKVHVGDIILVRAGERIPLDGIVIEGSSGLNTSALTGESLPRDVTVGDEVLSGCINISGTLRIKTVKEACDSTASRILELIEGASANKSKSEGFITKFAKWYTPAVIVIVILLAVIPPLFFNQSWSDWVYNALNILVISCPCALVISVPLTFFGGIGAASRKGILVKGSNYLETLSKCSTMVFDKTGTLTKGTFKIKRINAVGVSEEELLTLTAACERFSTHPLAHSILAYCGNRELPELSGNEELAGLGVRGTIDGHVICCGNIRLMEKIGVDCEECCEAGTAVYTSCDGKYIGYILIADEIKEDAAEGISRLQDKQSVRSVMLSGDRKLIAEETAEKLGISEVHYELLPEDKVKYMEDILADRSKNPVVAYVGDGINDAPVLARADVGIAMGGLGSDAAIEAADIVIMDDSIRKLPLAVGIAKQTVKIANENIAFALAVKFAVFILAAFGMSKMWMAILADVGVCLVAVLNSLRAMNSVNK